MMMVTVSTTSRNSQNQLFKLQSLGVNAELTGRNDIQVGQAKSQVTQW